MKILLPIISLAIFFFCGCAAPHSGAALNSTQARARAVQAANDKTFQLYHRRPFEDGGGQITRTPSGDWQWQCERGYGTGDIKAVVELAADGATRDAQVQLLSDRSF